MKMAHRVEDCTYLVFIGVCAREVCSSRSVSSGMLLH